MRTHLWLAGAAMLVGLAGSSADGQLLRQLEDRLGQPARGVADVADEAGPADAAYLGLVADNAETGNGVRVIDVNKGSPAEAAGLRTGDLITRANGHQITSLDDLADVLKPLAPGSKVDFVVAAGEETNTKSVTLGRRPAATPADDETAAPMPLAPRGTPPRSETPRDETPPSRTLPPIGDEQPPADFAVERPSLGITVGPITEDARVRYNLTTRRGALIVAVRPGSAADRAGLPVGGAVVAMDGVRIDTADQLVDAVRTSRPGQEVELGYYHGPNFTRKTVRLDSTGVPLEGPRPGARIDVPGDRPLLNAAERMFDSLARPGYAGIAAPGDFPEVDAMHEEIGQLRSQVKTLEERVRALEAKLNVAGAPAPRGEPAPRGPLNGPATTSPLNTP